MKKYFGIGIALVCILVYFIIKKNTEKTENAEKKKLEEVAAWCASDNSDALQCNIHLSEYIANAQVELNLLQEYCITTDEEWNLAKEIIKGFQKDLTENLFSYQLPIPNGKFEVSKETCFMYFLQKYLKQHQYNLIFLDYEMFKKTNPRKEFGSWGSLACIPTSFLTDFAVVLQKLLYITYMHCKNSSILDLNGKGWSEEHLIEDIIDSKKI